MNLKIKKSSITNNRVKLLQKKTVVKTKMRNIKRLIILFIILISPFILSPNIYAENTASTSGGQVKYDMPYPGMLPDNPLYFLKTTRDKIVSFLISDPLKKSEFSLIASDKRLLAAIMLINKGKSELAITTISKSNNYFRIAMDEYQKAKNLRREMGAIPGNLLLSSQKHKELLGSVLASIPKDKKARFEYEIKRVNGFEQELKNASAN